MWVWMCRLFEAVKVCCSFGSKEGFRCQCSHLHMGSLDRNYIGDEGARDLGAALQVNTTLMTLM
jgi:hypothetical protein